MKPEQQARLDALKTKTKKLKDDKGKAEKELTALKSVKSK